MVKLRYLTNILQKVYIILDFTHLYGGFNMMVVAAFLFNNKKLLLIKHKKTGLWLPVAGHVEKDETIFDAIKREIKEEVNLIDISYVMSKQIEGVIPLPLPFYTSLRKGEEIVEFIGYVNCLDGFKTDPGEILEHRWFALDDLDAVVPSLKEKIKIAFSIAYR